MNHEVAVLTFSKYPDIFEQFRSSIELNEPDLEKVIVLNSDSVVPPSNWTVVKGPDMFSEPVFFNLGLARISPNKDVLYVNDDVTFNRAGSMKELGKIAYTIPKIGILSPHVNGVVGNPLQSARSKIRRLTISRKRLAFVCVYIKRAVIDMLGGMDESYSYATVNGKVISGYGGSDVDYSHRAQKAGFLLAVAPQVRVNHGFGNHRASCSFIRTMTGAEKDASMHEMHKIFNNKWKTLKWV